MPSPARERTHGWDPDPSRTIRAFVYLPPERARRYVLGCPGVTDATAWSANPGQAITVVSLSAPSFEPLSRLAQSPVIHAINIDVSPPPQLH